MKDKDVARAELVDKLRETYLADLADGVERFFEPRREQCPWCESADIEVTLRTTDLLQHKPGRFVVDRCRDCGHRFQNPRLNAAGLEFYYRDCYDGLGEETMNKLFSAKDDTYVQRADALKSFAQPKSWLDIGTGHGHFPHLAKQVFPDTEFDGLDQSAGVELAQERGWVGTGYRGEFVDLAGELAQRYEAVSMFHYLEHTPDPRQQLQAAAKVIRPGGHLVIEVPDPESRWGRVLGRWWVPWLQPQHLNFIPIATLREALTGLGFTVLREQRAEAHGGYDLLPALLLLVHAALTRGDDVPWRAKPPSRLSRFVRTAGFKAAMPLFIATAIADRILAGFVASRGYANAYRMVAVKN